jgi:hypothetical protein|tara:strand:- start:817 stop:1047 length:231 start_codon:yes stop_codon:yes gene_type:complete
MRWYKDYVLPDQYYKNTSIIDYLWSNMDNDKYFSDLMESALDEVSTKYKIIKQKTVRRNGKVYRVTVEEVIDDESE